MKMKIQLTHIKTEKIDLKEKFMELNGYIRKEENFQINTMSSTQETRKRKVNYQKNKIVKNKNQ